MSQGCLRAPDLAGNQEETTLDWIERLFHVSPDGGSGSLEISIIAGAAVALALW
jgi:hypothetical protein